MEENKVSAITMALINNTLASIVDEMTVTVVRTTTSPPQRDLFDFLCSFMKADGEVLMEGEETLLHSNACSFIIHNWIERHGIDSIHPGDMYCVNDPFSGASHFPDIFILHPIFLGEELIAWSGVGGHMMDVGGRVGGSCDCLSRTCWEEGLRIPTVKVCDRGIRNDTFFTILAANSRLGDEIVGQLEPFLAACRIAERRFFSELVKKYGWETLKMHLDALLDYAESRARADIRVLPNGVYEFEDYMDDYGPGTDPIRFHVKITIDEDTMTYDFTGTSPQIEAGMNNPVVTTRACVYNAFRSLISLDIPHNGGALRAIKVMVPEGTVANPVLPGACGARGVTLGRIYETVIGAQAQIAPDKMPACAGGMDNLGIHSGYDKKRGRNFLFVDLPWGACGGRPTADGDYLNPPTFNGSTPPMEVLEDLYPVRYNQRAFVPDSEGAGKYRGGFGLVVDWEALVDGVTLQLRTDRSKTGPYGLYGGQPGSLSVVTFNPGGENHVLGKCVITMNKGDVVRVKVAGGGGWGDPLERDVELVMDDVVNEKVSSGRAREVYGVVIDERTMEVDTAETQKLRKKMKKANTE